MPFEFKKHQGITIAVLSGTLDKAQGEEFAGQVEREISKGGKLIVDGSDLKTLTQQGVLHLMTAQRWASVPERKRLSLAGFNSTVWRAIVENGSDFFFDSKPTLGEALQSFGVTAPAASAVPAASPAPPAVTLSPLDPPVVPPTATPSRAGAAPRDPLKADPWLQPLPSVPPPAPFSAPPPVVAPVSAYAPPVRPPLPTPVRPQPPKKSSGWIVAGLALLVFGGAAWWFLGSHVPVLTLSAPSTAVEEDGKEADEITAQVQHGRLVEKSWSDLPKGLYFEPPTDDSGTRTYTLRGKAESGAGTATVQLEAADEGGKHSAPVPFTVNVKEKPMTWQLNTLQSLGLKVGKRIWTQSKFLVNADSVTVKSGLPPGLAVERIPGKNKDWQLVGLPTAGGSYPVVFTAISPSGKHDEQSCALEVAAETEPPQSKPVDDNSTPVPVTVAASNVDDGMRQFLLDRIENLPSRYTDKDRENLRAVVGTLQQARLIYRVVFEREGQTELSADQSAKLKTALESGDNAPLIKDPACQIVVVGYASKTGSPASNVRISKLRARSVNDFLKGVVGHNADLCGDYGPTNVVDQAVEKNRAVEVYAGMLEPSSDMQANAERFKRDFNRDHGIH